MFIVKLFNKLFNTYTGKVVDVSYCEWTNKYFHIVKPIGNFGLTKKEGLIRYFTKEKDKCKKGSFVIISNYNKKRWKDSNTLNIQKEG